jgi:hypothetical protein
MKLNLVLRLAVAGLLIAGISGCAREGCTDPSATNYNSRANVDNGTCIYTGQALFYFDQNGPNAAVSINGQSGTITSNYPSTPPTCGSSGCATFSLAASVQGTSYPYTASSSLTS